MSEGNIRRRVVISFRNAIDFEQQSNDVVRIFIFILLKVLVKDNIQMSV